jgi:SsrA-binding protein
MNNNKIKQITYNNKAGFNYSIEQTIECGIVLKGEEVKSVRINKPSINQAHIISKNGELFIINWYIPEYKNSYQIPAQQIKYNPNQMRKLLLHKKEIARIIGTIQQSGVTCVPIECYSNNKNRIKIKIAIAKGKKEYDKREYIKQKDQRRESRAYKAE